MVSVIIVSFNTSELTLRCIEAVLGSVGVDLEIILVDNNSSDSTVKLVKRNFPNVLVVKNSKNLGFGSANNIGMEMSKGENVLLLNSDAFVDKDTIRICLERLNKEPECGVVGCRIKYPDGRFQMSAGNFPSFWRVCGLMLLSVSIIHDANRQNYEKSHKVDWVTGAFMLVSKKAIAATGGFDESFFMYGEEVEWQKRIWKAGYSVWYESGALIVHVGGGSHKDKYKVFLGEMAGYELWMKIYGNEMERFLLPVVINLGCLLRIVLFGVIGKSDMARTYLKVLFSRVSGKLG